MNATQKRLAEIRQAKIQAVLNIKKAFDSMFPNDGLKPYQFAEQLPNPQAYNINSMKDRVELVKAYESWLLNN